MEPIERDALKEIGEICGGAAATAIAKVTRRRTSHVTTQFFEVPARQLASVLGTAGHAVTGAAIRLTGEVRGALLIAADDPIMHNVADILQGKPAGATQQLATLEQSALKELVNQVTGSYMKTFYGFLDLDVEHHVPSFIVAPWDSMVKYTFLGNTPGSETVWAIASRLELALPKPLQLFLLLDAPGRQTVLNRVHQNLQH